jgi:WD40 repeat protein
VSTSIDGCLRIWDVLTGSEIAVNTSLPSPMDMDKKDNRDHVMNMRVHTANPCCFSRDGKTIVVGTEDAEIVLFDSDGTKVNR